MNHPQQALRNGGPVVTPRSDTTFQTVLRSGTCILSGGRDRQGGAILTFPRTSPALERVKVEELGELLRFLTSIPSDEVQRHGFTVIIDMRDTSWNNVKALLRALQDYFPCAVRSILIVKPDNFSHKPKSASGSGNSKYGFEILLISVDQLTKYLNVSELTKDFGGSLHYIHEEWVELRRIVQDFVGHAADMLDRIDQCKKALLNAELANDLTSTDALLIEHHALKKKLNKYPVELLEEEGYKILSRLDPKFDPYDPRHSSLTNGSSRNCISQNPDFQAALSRVRLQLDRLHNVRGQLLQAWQNRLEKLEQCRQLRAFEQQAEQMLEWINLSRKRFLATYTDVGTSFSLVKELEKQHEQFQIDCMGTFLHIDRVLELGNKLLQTNHYASQVIKLVTGKLDHERKAFQAGLKDRSSVLALSATFHRKAEEFTKNFNEWNNACEMGVAPVESSSLEKMIGQHDFITKSIAQMYSEVHSFSKELMHYLDRHFLFCRRALSDFVCPDGKSLLSVMQGSGEVMAEDSATSKADYTRSAEHILELARSIQSQQRYLKERCEAKQAVLEQHWALRLYQEEVRQVIDWIQNDADPFLAKNREIGRTLASAKELRKRHVLFEANAQNTYANAAKLLDASDQLMQKKGFNIEDVQISSAELNKCVREFAARVAARRVMLDTACGFFEHVSTFTAHLERAKKSLQSEPSLDSLESIVEGLNRLNHERQAVMECVALTDREGYALLSHLRESGMSQTPDHHHIDNTLRLIAASREELENSWEPRRQKLDIFLKLRMFERSVAEITSEIALWIESVQHNAQKINAQLAEQEFNTLDARVGQLQTLSEQADDRGQELLSCLEGLAVDSGVVDRETVESRVNDLLDELADHQGNLSEGAEIYRIHLQNIIQLHNCNFQGQEILMAIQICQNALKALPLALLSLDSSKRIHAKYDKIQFDVERLRRTVIQFQAFAEEIAQNDIDGAEVAHRLLDRVTAQWQHLLILSDELCRGISNGVAFYQTAQQVCSFLQSLLDKEYRDDEDWCSTDKFQRTDKVAAMASLVNRHVKQKEDFMKACNHARKTSEAFLKFVARSCTNHPESQASLAGVDAQVQGLLELIKRLEDSVMHHWAHRKKQFDFCQQYVSVETSAQKVIKWIQSTGEHYLATRTSVGSTQSATEALLNEHNDFVGKAKENNDKIRIVMLLAEELVNNGHSHATGIKSWVSAVETRQKDFISRMEAYRLQLENKLGVVQNAPREAYHDRNSDASLEGKLQEMSGKLISVEEAKKTKQREFIMTELLQTERTFVKDLSECVQYFVNEAKGATSGIYPPPGLSTRLPIIFGNIEEIYQFHNEVFLKELEKYEMMPEDVAHCFVTWTPKFDMYVEYCKDRLVAIPKVIEPASVEYFKKVQAHYTLPNTIDSYLIKPVQRITKYGQLLEQLLKNCVDDRHEIRDALDMMRNVPKKANDAMNLSLLENYDEPLEQLGELILMDSFHVSEPKQLIPKTHQRQIFLFELGILFTKKVCDGTKDPKFIYKNKLLTAGLGITECFDKDPCNFVVWMGRSSQPASSSSGSETKFVLRAPSLDVKLIWIQKLRQVVQDNCVNTSLSVALAISRVPRNTHNSRGSKEYEDSLSLEETSGSNERYSIISRSSSNTTDSDKGLYEGDWATVTENYEAIHDGELTVTKGECVEILDRASKGDFYHVRVKSGPASRPSHKTPQIACLHKVLDGYLPGAVLALVPNNRSARHLSPTRTMSIDQSHDDGFSGSTSTSSTLPVPSSASDRALHCDDASNTDSGTSNNLVPPTTKRRNTFRKWLTNPVRKLSQNRIETAGVGGRNSVTTVTSTASSRVKSLFQSHAQSSSSSAVLVSAAASDELRRASAPPLAVSEVEDLPGDSDHHHHQHQQHQHHQHHQLPTAYHNASASAPVSQNVSLDVDPTNGNAHLSVSSDLRDDHVGLSVGAPVPEMPHPMEQIHSFPGLISNTLLASGSAAAGNTDTILSIRPSVVELAGEIENLVKKPLTSRGNIPDSVSSLSSSSLLHQMEDPSGALASSAESNGAISASFKPDEGPSPSAVTPVPERSGGSSNEHVNGDDEKKPSESEADILPAELTIEESAASPDPIVRAITMRDYVLRELVDTERDYVKDLGLIIDGYVAHMHENAMPDDMNGREKLIFGNIQQIYVFHRDTFCGELEKCLEAADRLPQVFIRYERRFQMYVVYCQNKPKSEFVVSEYIDTYFEDIRLKLGQKLKLPDMLIKPVQRVMRYQLMLKDIVKYTERAQMPVRDLQRAIGCIMGVCKLANDFMEVGRLQGFEGNLTAQGKLVLQDSFLVCETFTAAPPVSGQAKDKDKDKDTSNNKFKERQIFVFEQVVLFSEAVGQGHKKSTYSSPIYVYKSQIQVNKMSLIEVPQDTVRFALRSRCPHSGDRMFVIEAPDKEKRDMWVTQIKNMLETQQNFLRALQSPIDFQRRAQQGDEVMMEDTATPAPPILSTVPTSPASVVSRPPLNFHATDVATADRPPQARLSKFLRPKSYTAESSEDRRRTISVARTPDPTVLRGYGGASTTPITPPAVDLVEFSATAKLNKFLFPPPSLKVVHSEADLLKRTEKNQANPSTDLTASGSKASLVVSDQPDAKSRRWSISGRRDKPPIPAPLPKDRVNSSFRKKN